MHQLLTMIAAVTPTEILVDKLEDSIKEWKIYKDEERLKSVVFDAHLIILKQVTKGNIEGAMEVMKDMGRIEQYRKMFENKES